MTRTYIKDEEHPIPPSDATLLDLALAQLLLPDDKIDSKSLYLPSGLRRALRDGWLELVAENARLKRIEEKAGVLLFDDPSNYGANEKALLEEYHVEDSTPADDADSANYITPGNWGGYT